MPPQPAATGRRSAVALGLAGLLLGVGTLHLLVPRPFDAIIPDVVPDQVRRPLTIASGVVELAVGALLAVPRTRRVGGRAAQLLFLALLPANVQAALDGGYDLPGFLGSPAAAWLRVPLQIPLIVLAGRVAAAEDAERG